MAGIDYRSPTGLAQSLANPSLVSHLANHLVAAAAAEGLRHSEWPTEATRPVPPRVWHPGSSAASSIADFAPPSLPSYAGSSAASATGCMHADMRRAEGDRHGSSQIPQLLNLVAQGEMLARGTYHFPPRVAPRVQQGRTIERELRNMTAQELVMLHEQEA
jgi:hypothetical protein